MLIKTLIYLPYTLFLVFAVFIIPAVAVFPSLLESAWLASVLPIISIFIVNIIVVLLLKFGIYTHDLVLLITVGLAFLAFIRILFIKKRLRFLWSKEDVKLIIINLSLLLPMLALAGFSVFSRADALTSWNLWALHWYQSIPVHHTTYPQLFPRFLSYCYHLLGSVEAQGPIKASLVILPFALMNAATFYDEKNRGEYLPLFLFFVFGFILLFYKFFVKGYADPFNAVPLAFSVAMFLKYFETRQEIRYLFFGAFCGIVAYLSKQPALLWGLIGAPALFIAKFIETKKLEVIEILALIVITLPAIFWLTGPGADLFENQGVIQASMHSLHPGFYQYVTTLVQSIMKYFLKQPFVLLIYVFAILAVIKRRYALTIFLIFIVPSTLLWFIFASYELREGLHLLTTSALLIASVGFFHDVITSRFDRYCKFTDSIRIHLTKICLFFLLIGIASFIVVSIVALKKAHGHIYPLHAGKTLLYKFFGDAAPTLYKNAYNRSNVFIWTAGNAYARGIFYSHNPFSDDRGYTIKQAYAMIKRLQPDFVVTGGDITPSEDRIIQILSQRCSGLLINLPTGATQHRFQVYKVNKAILNRGNCRVWQLY